MAQYLEDLQQPQQNTRTQQAPQYLEDIQGQQSGESNVIPMKNTFGTQSIPAQAQSNQPLGDSVSDFISQAGKAVYENPIWHPGLRILSNLTGSNAEQAYASVSNPTTMGGKLGRAAGSVASVLPIAGPIGEAIAAAEIPAISSSAILSGGATGLAYGGLERGAQELQGQKGNLTNPLQTAKDFAVFGAVNRIGSTVLGRALKPVASQLMKVGTTPEGVGSVLGGYLAGSAISNDDDRIANGIMGAAVNALAPAEQYKMLEGAGEKMGPNTVIKAVGMFDKGHQELARFWVKDAPAVEAAGQIGPRGETSANKAADTIVGGFDTVRKMGAQDVSSALQEAEQKAKTGDMIYVNNKSRAPLINTIDTLINSISGPSAIKNAYNNVKFPATGVLFRYAIDGKSAVNLGLAPNDFTGKIYYVNGADISKVPQNVKIIGNKQLSPQGVEILRSKMMDIAYSGDGNASIAHDIAKECSNFLKSSQIDPQGKYARGMKTYEDMYNAQGELKQETGTPMPNGNFDSNKLAESLAKNYHLEEDTSKGNRRRTLENLDSYFNNLAKTRDPSFNQFTTKGLIDNYLAYEGFSKTQSAGITKIMPMRIMASAAIGGASSMMGAGPIGGTLGALAAYHLSSPAAWKPLLTGAYKAGTRSVLQRLMSTKSYIKR